MVKSLLNAVNKLLSHDDFGKLLLRLAVGGLMLFHGLHKLFDGVGGISNMLVAKGLPGFIAYGVLVGEVVAPCLLILGVLTRPAALVLAFTMVVAWLMVGTGKTFALDAVGAFMGAHAARSAASPCSSCTSLATRLWKYCFGQFRKSPRAEWDHGRGFLAISVRDHLFPPFFMEPSALRG